MSGARPPNLVAVVLDCTRAKEVGPGPREGLARTPNLWRLAAEGTWFSRAVAPGNWTMPSHMSMMTGLPPWLHGVRTFVKNGTSRPKVAEWLRDHGYDTGMFAEEVHLVAGYGLEDGYQARFSPRTGLADEDRTWSNRWFGQSRFAYSAPVRGLMHRFPRLAVPLSSLNFRQEVAFKHSVSNDRVLAEFESWVRSRPTDRPFHAFVNLVDAHEPYPELLASGSDEPGAGFARVPRFYLLAVDGLARRVPWPLVASIYRRAIEEADTKLGRLIRALEESGRYDDTVLVVTSDHGQSFGEGGNVYHGCGATDSVLRVPLVVWAPPRFPRIAVVDAWTSLCELPSWFKSCALGRPPFDPDGRAAVPFPSVSLPALPLLAEGGPASDPNRSLAGIGLDHRWNHRLFAAYRAEDKWVWDSASGLVWHWNAGPDTDSTHPEPLDAAARAAVLRDQFGVHGPEDISRLVGAGAPVARVSPGDGAMRSWGYD